MLFSRRSLSQWRLFLILPGNFFLLARLGSKTRENVHGD
jgi:hypothetical protein